MKQRKFYEYEMSLFLKEGVKLNNPTDFSWNLVGRDNDTYKALHKIPHYLVKKYAKKINWFPIGMGYKLTNESNEVVGNYLHIDELPLNFIEAFRKYINWENLGSRIVMEKPKYKIAHTETIKDYTFGKNIEEMNFMFLQQYGKYMNWENVGSGNDREHISQFSDIFIRTFKDMNVYFKVEYDFRKL